MVFGSCEFSNAKVSADFLRLHIPGYRSRENFSSNSLEEGLFRVLIANLTSVFKNSNARTPTNALVGLLRESPERTL